MLQFTVKDDVTYVHLPLIQQMAPIPTHALIKMLAARGREKVK